MPCWDGFFWSLNFNFRSIYHRTLRLIIERSGNASQICGLLKCNQKCVRTLCSSLLVSCMYAWYMHAFHVIAGKHMYWHMPRVRMCMPEKQEHVHFQCVYASKWIDLECPVETVSFGVWISTSRPYIIEFWGWSLKGVAMHLKFADYSNAIRSAFAHYVRVCWFLACMFGTCPHSTS